MMFDLSAIGVAHSSDGQEGWRLKTRLYRKLLLILYTCVLYPYVSACTNMSQFSFDDPRRSVEAT